MPGGKVAIVEEEQVWPPVVKSVMEPMSLPIVRPPEPEGAGAIFCGPSGDLVATDDSLFFIQLPTTLPLSSVVTKVTRADEDDPMDGAEDAKEQETKKTKENANSDDSPYAHVVYASVCTTLLMMLCCVLLTATTECLTTRLRLRRADILARYDMTGCAALCARC